MTSRPGLPMVVDALLDAHGPAELPPADDPFGLILWEQVGYLASDERRREAFEQLRERVGLTPEAILAASTDMLEEITGAGGSIAVSERAGRMRWSAQTVVDEWGGDLLGALKRAPSDAARTLERFPMIGEPGADKILMLTRPHAVLALDSNGLRVLLRLGYGEEGKSYAATYRSVREAVVPECAEDLDWLARAYGLLRLHGQRTCKRSAPRCSDCNLAEGCPSAVRS